MTILPCLLMLLVMRTLVDDVFLGVFFGSTIQCLQHTQQRHDAEKFSHVYIESFCSAVIVRIHGSVLHRRWRWKQKWKQRFVLRDLILHPHLNIAVLQLRSASSQELE
jgi:hypothetical protein